MLWLLARLGAIDVGALFELAWAALLAALVVIVAWGLLVYGSTRASEWRREGRLVAAGFGAAVATAGGALFAAAVVVGLVIMASKG